MSVQVGELLKERKKCETGWEYCSENVVQNGASRKNLREFGDLFGGTLNSWLVGRDF